MTLHRLVFFFLTIAIADFLLSRCITVTYAVPHLSVVSIISPGFFGIFFSIHT